MVPLNTTVGLAFTDINALPLRSAGKALHLLSLTAVRVYVLVDVGNTEKV